MLGILSNLDTTKDPPWLGPEENFHHGGSQKAEKAILRFVFANTILHKRAILLVFYAGFTESVIETLPYLESTMGAPRLGPEKHFQNQGSPMAEKRHF